MSFMPRFEEVEADLLIIGGGLAGLMCAVEAARRVNKVVIAAKGRAGKSGNTIMARNGMAAVMEEGYDGDSAEQHAEDTLAGGHYINNTRMVETFAENAHAAIKRLMELGVPFLEENGVLLRKGSPGHSRRRFLTVNGSAVKSPKTQGLAITLPLVRAAEKLGVQHVDGVMITGLLKREGRVTGAWGLDKKEERVWVFKSGTTVIACGGAGGLYPATTNTADVTGDGYALASMAGAELRDMEFVQFHPAVDLSPPGMAMSTALFTDGAVLLNKEGERYMERYSQRGELATRDVMARATFTEIIEGRGTKNGGVIMDFTSVPEKTLQSKYSDLYIYLKGKKTIEVAPAMHFMMGGVKVDEFGRTTVPGLYAVGEAAGGLHGANRLAGNALTEAAVFGMLAGRQAALEAEKANIKPEASLKQEILNSINEAAGTSKEKDYLPELRKALKAVMGAKVSLMRSEEGLAIADKEINYLKMLLAHINTNDWKELTECYQLMLMLVTASAVTGAALKRKESLGAHYMV